MLTAEQEPNDARLSANTFVGNDTLSGAISTVADVDWWKVDLNAGDSLWVGSSINPDHAAFNPTLELYNSAGEYRLGTFDGSSLQYTASATDTYYVRMSASNDVQVFLGAYSVGTSVTAFAGTTETESNGTLATANVLAAGLFRGSISTSGDVDYFRGTLVAGQTLVIAFSDIPSRRPSVRLQNSAGTTLASNLDGNGLLYTPTTTATYYFRFAADNSAGTFTGSYAGTANVRTDMLIEGSDPIGGEFVNPPELDLGPYVVPVQYLGRDTTFQAHGLTGSYVNASLRSVSAQTDWIQTQMIAGTRIDPEVRFGTNGWGTRSSVGLTGGSDTDWDNFSVQWDGYIRIPTGGTQLALASDDGSRLWIDLNNDGQFATSGSELVNNNWGFLQGTTLSALSTPLAAGDYLIRIQYEEGFGGNNAALLWTDAERNSGAFLNVGSAGAGGYLRELGDVDVYAIDVQENNFYTFLLDQATGAIDTQGRRMTLYNEYGQPLEWTSAQGQISSRRYLTRFETTGRRYLAIQATDLIGLGPYAINVRVSEEFPSFRDIPLFYQDYTQYNHADQIPSFVGMFQGGYDPYQVDVTLAPPTSGEHVDWHFQYTPGGGTGGSEGGNFGTRRPSGSGSGETGANWLAFQDVWFGLPVHENGHGVGLPHARQPFDVMGNGIYGGQGDLFPIGKYTRLDANGWYASPALQNEREYLDLALEAGRVFMVGEANDTPALAVPLDGYIAEMMFDTDPRNDSTVALGRIDGPSDSDYFRLTVGAGEKWSFDVDAAEFQRPLDAVLRIRDGNGAVLATSDDARDLDSGLTSVDPYLVYTFATAGTYYIELTSKLATAGGYRLKVTPSRAFDTNGPRVVAAWPNGDAVSDATRQLQIWFNDQIDPNTLTGANIVVTGQTSGVRTGNAIFDPLTSTLIWRADKALLPDTYTLRLVGGAGGITDLVGNRLDGETSGVLTWPQVSGDGIAGGDFVTRFMINANDTTTAQLTGTFYDQHQFGRGMFTLQFDDELDLRSLYQSPFVLRGAGPDRTFDTTDDTLGDLDVFLDTHRTPATSRVYAYAAGVPDAGVYRIDAVVLDAAGHSVQIHPTITVAADLPMGLLFTGAHIDVPGLTGSYFNQSLRNDPAAVDWTSKYPVAGTRVDPRIALNTGDFGSRAEVGITGGTDQDWDNFSVQWDGYVYVPQDGVRLATRSDDGSRLWIDIDHDAVFGTSSPELISNGWGNGQGLTTGPFSPPLAQGIYKIRIQYEEGGGGNGIFLVSDTSLNGDTWQNHDRTLSVVDMNVQPGSTVGVAPSAVDVTFSGAVDPATLTVQNIRLRYSADATFYDGNDQYISEFDGQIAWDSIRHVASFRPASVLTNGYYMLELSSGAAGIHDLAGDYLDGEYLDGFIAGGVAPYGWEDYPSGNSMPGGDYRAFFAVSNLNRIPGDYNGDQTVNAADYVVWRKTDIAGTLGYATWRANFGRTSVPTHTISGTRQQPLGSIVTVAGVVTTTTDLVDSTSFRNFFIQDATGGIAVFGTTAQIQALLSGITEGDSVAITGPTGGVTGLFELNGLAGPLFLVETGHPGIPQPTPVTTITLADFSSQGESLEGMVVKLSGVSFVGTGTFAGLQNYTITDGATQAVVRVSTTQQDIVGTAIPTGPVNLIGILSQFDSTVPPPAPGVPGKGYQLLLRTVADIVSSAGSGASVEGGVGSGAVVEQGAGSGEQGASAVMAEVRGQETGAQQESPFSVTPTAGVTLDTKMGTDPEALAEPVAPNGRSLPAEQASAIGRVDETAKIVSAPPQDVMAFSTAGQASSGTPALPASGRRIGAQERVQFLPPADPAAGSPAGAVGVLRDDALQAWLGSLGDGREEDGGETDGVGDGQDCPSYGEAVDDAIDALDVAFEGVAHVTL